MPTMRWVRALARARSSLCGALPFGTQPGRTSPGGLPALPVVLLLGAMLALLPTPHALSATAGADAIYNYHPIDPLFATAGQITEEQARSLPDLGFEYVINLAVADPQRNAREAFLVVEAGLNYAHIPVDWQQPSARDLELFFALMDARGGRRTLVHCFANYRASAFVYLYRTLHLGEDEASARADLEALWTDDIKAKYPHWIRFMEEMKTQYPGRAVGESGPASDN
jgi:protein tyrosine phosphatase (PTP) superfamily phosphohydrolase (DUF442 family)